MFLCERTYAQQQKNRHSQGVASHRYLDAESLAAVDSEKKQQNYGDSLCRRCKKNAFSPRIKNKFRFQKKSFVGAERTVAYISAFFGAISAKFLIRELLKKV